MQPRDGVGRVFEFAKKTKCMDLPARWQASQGSPCPVLHPAQAPEELGALWVQPRLDIALSR